MSDLKRDRVTDRRDQREHAHPLRDAVPEHNLRRDIGRAQAELAENFGLDRGVDIGVGADWARKLADGNRLPGAQQTIPAAVYREGKVRDTVSPDIGLGVDAVRAA